jgi:hypothetical protein
VTDRWPLAVLAAAVWGINPINEGALGWYAVYGQVLATTCILIILVRFAGTRAGHCALLALLAEAASRSLPECCSALAWGAAADAVGGLVMLPADSGRVRRVVALTAAIVILHAYGGQRHAGAALRRGARRMAWRPSNSRRRPSAKTSSCSARWPPSV